MSKQQLWLELPPISGSAPRRLMVFLHEDGSSPEKFAPVALSWQLKFPGATVLVMQAPVEVRPYCWAWVDSQGIGKGPIGLNQTTDLLMARLSKIQQQENFIPHDTVMVGLGQGANLVLEAARTHGSSFGIEVAYSGRLGRPFQKGEFVAPDLHLVHGNRDPLNPSVYARQLFDALNTTQASATFDLVEDGGHSINQDMIITGTTRVMQTIFRRRKIARMKTLN